MFNFYPNRKVERVFSNPSVPDLVVIEPLLKDGKVTNHVRKIPQDINGLLRGAVYDPETMSLRAKLNMGVSLDFVPNPDLDSFDVAYVKISKLSNTITSKYAELLNSATQVPVVESSKE